MPPLDDPPGDDPRRKLHLHIDRLCLDEALSVEGWLFHENLEVVGIELTVVNRRGVQRVKARTGRDRPDVRAAWGFETARRSGFGVGGVELADEGDNRLAFVLELAGGETLPLDICRLRLDEGKWAIERLVPECPQALEFVQFTPDRWGGEAFARGRSLGAVLPLLSGGREPAPPLPEPVALLVSVYRGRPYLRPFFTSLLTNTSSPYSLVLIDNGNDDPSIIAYLRGLAAAHDNITLVRLEENRGYVGAMCLAIDYAPPDRHVVALNTDTVLPPNWLERLVGPLFEDPTIASTTPFTNAGTSVSFPLPGEDNPLYLGLAVETIDAAFARLRGAQRRIELPSGVGFCMAHSRTAIDRIGWYDATAFGAGYGEENDWSLRARRAGLRNVLVPNLFVYHKHGGIYGEEKAALQKTSHAIVVERYPQYDAEVADYFRADPAGPLRDLVAFMLAARHGAGRTLLLFDHELGGGSQLFAKRLIEDRLAQGDAVVRVAWSASDACVRVGLRAAGVDRLYRQSSLDDALALARLVDFDEVIVNQLADMREIGEGIAKICRFVEAAGAALTVHLHDYFLLCPSLNLLNGEHRYCGLPDLDACERCAAENPYFRLEPGERQGLSMRSWRAAMGRLVALARNIVCFSRESALRLARVYAVAPERLTVIPHFADHLSPPRRLSASARPGLRIAVIGAIHEAKGARLVGGLAEAIRARRDPSFALTVVGTNETTHQWPGVTVTGQYLTEQLAETLAQHEINLVFIPSVWPETFSYVAEEAMCLGLPLAVFDLGAPAERVRLYPRGSVLPLCEGERLLDALLQSVAGQPKTRTDRPIEGVIDRIERHEVRGWVSSAEDRDDHLLVEAFLDGALLGLGWADRARPEHSAADHHGFAIELAPPIAESEVRRLEVFATAASGRRAALAAAPHEMAREAAAVP